MSLREDLFFALFAPGNPVLDSIMVAFGVAGLLPFTLLWSVPLWVGQRRRDAVDLVLLLILDALLTAGLKLLFAVPRPPGPSLYVPLDDVSDFAFPSGHATRAFAAATLLTARFRDWRWGAALFAYAGIVAVSRIYVGVHWPADVVAGAAFGVAWGFAFDRATRTAPYARWRDGLLARLRA